MTLVQPLYFAPILQYVVIAQNNELCFEMGDNYQKQTHRNRCYIKSANGKLALTIPVLNSKSGKQKTSETKIDYKYQWIRQHLKSLQTAYENSPFFEYYVHDIELLLNRQFVYLVDLNLACHDFINTVLNLDKTIQKSTVYTHPLGHGDYRYLANAKVEPNIPLDPYHQLFIQKDKFIPNLSVLDLLFMEGPASSVYLENQIIVK